MSTSMDFHMIVLLLLIQMMRLRMLKLLIHLTMKTIVIATRFDGSFLGDGCVGLSYIVELLRGVQGTYHGAPSRSIPLRMTILLAMIEVKMSMLRVMTVKVLTMLTILCLLICC